MTGVYFHCVIVAVCLMTIPLSELFVLGDEEPCVPVAPISAQKTQEAVVTTINTPPQKTGRGRRRGCKIRPSTQPLVVETTSIQTTTSVTPPEGWIEYENHYYYVSKQNASGFDVKDECQKINSKSHPASLETKEELDFLYKHLPAAPDGEIDEYYTSGQFRNNLWTWENTGALIDESVIWLSTNSYGTPNFCVVLIPFDYRVRYCGRERRFICEIDQL